MFRYRQLDLTGIPGFSPGDGLQFADGITPIATAPFEAALRIVEALRGDWGAERLRTDGWRGPEIPVWIGFFDSLDRGVELPYGGTPWAPLAALFTTPPGAGLDRAQLAQDTGAAVTAMLARKFEGLSKFSGVVAPGESVTARILDDGRTDLLRADGRSINYGFQASGERHILILALNHALRRQIPAFDQPFVENERMDSIPSELWPEVPAFVLGLGGQQIILEPPEVLARLGLAPDYVIEEGDEEDCWRLRAQRRH